MNEDKVKIFDEEHRIMKEMPVKDIENQLEKIKQILKKCLTTLEEVNGYELDNFEIGLSLRAGFWVITADGSITLTYEKKDY